MRKIAAALLSILIVGCNPSSNSINLHCGSRPADSSLSLVERKILFASIARAKESCGLTGDLCHFTISTRDSEVLVFGQLAPVKGGKCVRISGGNWIDRYDQEGYFTERLLGM